MARAMREDKKWANTASLQEALVGVILGELVLCIGRFHWLLGAFSWWNLVKQSHTVWLVYVSALLWRSATQLV